MFSNQLNQRAAALCQLVKESAEQLEVQVIDSEGGATVLDFGTDQLGTLAGGVLLAKICMSDLANVSIVPSHYPEFPLPLIQVETDHPLEACIASQYAGWPFSTEHFFSMCSGPARLKRGREEILTTYDLPNSENQVVGIFESNQVPSAEDLEEFAEQCRCPLSGVSVCVARTSSLPGSIQVVARSVETALHKLFELGFDLTKVKRAIGTAPIPPVGSDDYQSMGWTNDSILYGGDVVLWIEDVDDVEELIAQLPSQSSEEFGKPFIDIFEKYDRDFYKVDRLLFSPARITIVCTVTGKFATAGQIRIDLLDRSFQRNQ